MIPPHPFRRGEGWGKGCVFALGFRGAKRVKMVGVLPWKEGRVCPQVANSDLFHQRGVLMTYAACLLRPVQGRKAIRSSPGSVQSASQMKQAPTNADACVKVVRISDLAAATEHQWQNAQTQESQG